MSAKIIPFKSAPVPASVEADVPMTIQQLEAADHDLQIQAHAINIAIGEIRRQRLALLRRRDASRSA